MKLWLAGLHSVRVSMMGGGLVLLFCNSGEDVGELARDKDWWGGLLFDIKPWSPNQVCSRREIWLSMFGIPLHAWGEDTFRKLANKCGVFVEIDEATRNNERFDVARVKVEAALCGRIDFVVKLIIQGASYVVRVVEECCGLAKDDVSVEDQLRRSDVASSCASGGHGSVRAVLGGFDGTASDSDASEEGQHGVPLEMQVASESKGYNQGLRLNGVRSEGGSGVVMAFPSKEDQVMVTCDKEKLLTNVGVRGSKHVVFGGGSGHMEEGGRHVTSKSCGQQIPLTLSCEVGSVGPINVTGHQVETTQVELGLVNQFDPTTSQTIPMLEAVEVSKGPMSNTLDNLIQQSLLLNTEAANSISKAIFPVSSAEGVTLAGNGNLTSVQKKGKIRKAPIPFPSLLGPRCLRFAGVINNGVLLQKKKRSVGSVSETAESETQLSDGGTLGSEAGATQVIQEGEFATQPVLHQQQLTQGFELSVVLPFHCEATTDSGVRHILNEDSLQNVDEFVAARGDPSVMKLEAEKLLSNQQEFGVNFDSREILPVARMVNMEVRDRSKLSLAQESNGLQ
jgi:hypothetical protein